MVRKRLSPDERDGIVADCIALASKWHITLWTLHRMAEVAAREARP
jgi:hypothetical protein